MFEQFFKYLESQLDKTFENTKQIEKLVEELDRLKSSGSSEQEILSSISLLKSNIAGLQTSSSSNSQEIVLIKQYLENFKTLFQQLEDKYKKSILTQ